MEESSYINIITLIIYNITIISRSIDIRKINSTDTNAAVQTECTQDVDTICVESTDIPKEKID
jgi:hypothetical protein